MPRPYFSLDAPVSGPLPPFESIDWDAKFAAARAERWHRRETRLRARADHAEARRHGLVARHATKLSRLHAARPVPADDLCRTASAEAIRGFENNALASI